MQVFAAFNEIGIVNQLATALLAACLPDGVHPSHFSILNHLARLGDGKTPVRIASAMQVTKNTMTHSLKVLEGRGLIEVRANPDDGRGKLVFLTEAGRRFRDEAITRVTERFDAVLTPEIREVLARLQPDLTTLRRHLDDNRD
jgi:DNA-binding MarR family transcriptional regulator